MSNVENTKRATRDSKTEDRVVGLVLRIGAYASIALILLGGVLMLIGSRGVGIHIAEAGVLVLMSTPITRVFVAAIVFWREGDRHYAWISVGVFVILITTSVLAALKVMPTLEH